MEVQTHDLLSASFPHTQSLAFEVGGEWDDFLDVLVCSVYYNCTMDL